MTETIDTAQPEALRLADAIDPFTRKFLDNLTCSVAAAELRRLHSALAAAEARNATLTDDAARYRYLRDETEWEPFDSAWLIKNDIYGCPTLAMDVAIDAARAAASIGAKGDADAQ